jgi:hypothetical protein
MAIPSPTRIHKKKKIYFAPKATNKGNAKQNQI